MSKWFKKIGMEIISNINFDINDQFSIVFDDI